MKEDKVVSVWYATNRARNSPFNPMAPYGSSRAYKIDYGVSKVLIPVSHARGSTGSTFMSKLTGKDKPVEFMGATPATSEHDFWSGMLHELRSIKNDDKVVLVFIHGYNNDFEDAARRTAQIWADLRLNGIPAFFSWPSRNKTGLYSTDEASIEYSEKHLEEFLTKLRLEVGGTPPIHLIAHSMGNRALMRIAAKVQGKRRFGQIILAAPDLDSDVFLDNAQAYGSIANRTTIYVSRTDRPVLFSKKFHSADRVGAPPAFVQATNIDTVEVLGKRGLLDLGHSFFAEHEYVLDDIQGLIKENPMGDSPYTGKRTKKKGVCAEDVRPTQTQESCLHIDARELPDNLYDSILKEDEPPLVLQKLG